MYKESPRTKVLVVLLRDCSGAGYFRCFRECFRNVSKMLSKETKAGSGVLYAIRVVRSTLKTTRKTPETKAREALETLVVSADVSARN